MTSVGIPLRTYGLSIDVLELFLGLIFVRNFFDQEFRELNIQKRLLPLSLASHSRWRDGGVRPYVSSGDLWSCWFCVGATPPERGVSFVWRRTRPKIPNLSVGCHHSGDRSPYPLFSHPGIGFRSHSRRSSWQNYLKTPSIFDRLFDSKRQFFCTSA